MKAPTPPGRIIITGFMCAGKTTVARALAARLACAMLDTDELIVAREGRSIEAIIGVDGEDRFRQIERDALRDALDNGGACVIALGGGAWTFAENRALIAAHGDCLTVWLDAPFDLCWRRIARADQVARPLARERESASALYEIRRESYELAAVRVEITEDAGAEDTAAKIVSIIGRQSFADEHEGREEEKSNG